jgi:hypothetical protein
MQIAAYRPIGNRSMLTKSNALPLFLKIVAATQLFGSIFFVCTAASRIVELRNVDQVSWIFFVAAAIFGLFAWALFRGARSFRKRPE